MLSQQQQAVFAQKAAESYVNYLKSEVSVRADTVSNFRDENIDNARLLSKGKKALGFLAHATRYPEAQLMVELTSENFSEDEVEFSISLFIKCLNAQSPFKNNFQNVSLQQLDITECARQFVMVIHESIQRQIRTASSSDLSSDTSSALSLNLDTSETSESDSMPLFS